jgi:hypothetical protein
MDCVIVWLGVIVGCCCKNIIQQVLRRLTSHRILSSLGKPPAYIREMHSQPSLPAVIPPVSPSMLSFYDWVGYQHLAFAFADWLWRTSEIHGSRALSGDNALPAFVMRRSLPIPWINVEMGSRQSIPARRNI